MSIIASLRLSYAPATAFVIVGLFWGSFAAFVPVIKAKIGASDAQFGLLLLGTAIGLASTIVLAPIIDRKLGAWAMPVCSVVLAFAFLFPGLATTPVTFFAAMLVAGMASGLTDVIMNARVSQIETLSGKSLMNANHGMFSLAYATGAFLTGLAREAGATPQNVFVTVALFTLLAATQMRMAVAPSQDDAATHTIFPHKIVLICGAVVLIAFMTEAAVEAWSALHIERTLGGGAAEGAFGPTMLGLTMAIGRFSGQAASERFSDLKVVFYAAILCIMGALVVASAPVPLVAYIGFATVGLGVSVIGPLGLALTGRLVRPSVRTAAISRAAVLGFVGFFIAPAIMGIVSDSYGLRVAYAGLAVFILALFPLLAVIRGWSSLPAR